MSDSPTSRGVPRQSPQCQTLPRSYRELVGLGFESLGCEVSATSDDAIHVSIPENQRHAFGDRAEISLAFSENGNGAADRDSPETLPQLLWSAVARHAAAIHAEPADQPVSVHQLAEHLLAPFQVDGGRAHVGGCSLDPRPFLRLSTPQGQSGWKHQFFDRQGAPLADDTVDLLGMRELKVFASGRSRLARPAALDWTRQAVLASGQEGAELPSGRPIATVVWCRYAVGKLAFEIGGEEEALPFEGWARAIAAGRTPPPRYRCALSGRESYHLVADWQGRITAAEAIALCEVSGRRVIETDLEICQQTGKRALKEYFSTCEQTHRRVLKSTLQACDMCRRQLAAVSLARGRCEACRHQTPVSKDDPTLARLLHQYPKLDGWSRWRISETPRLFIFTAQSWLQRLLVVVDKHSLEASRLATKNRFGNRWTDAPPKLWEELTS